MSRTIPLDQAAARLKELIGELAPGDEIVLTENDRTVGRIVPPERTKPVPPFGWAKGVLTVISEDEEHLEDFKEYMP